MEKKKTNTGSVIGCSRHKIKEMIEKDNQKARMKNKIKLQRSMQLQKMSEEMKYESGRNQRCGGI